MNRRGRSAQARRQPAPVNGGASAGEGPFKGRAPAPPVDRPRRLATLGFPLAGAPEPPCVRRWLHRFVLVTLVIVPALSGCDSRVRDNPFDPLNPHTHGRPSLLTAIAGDHRVDLRWDDGGILDVAGFTVYRGVSPDSLVAIESVMPDRRSFRDVGLSNDVTYFYEMGFAFLGQGELRTTPEPVTPGPDRPWVLDTSEEPLALLAADGRHVASRHADGDYLVDISVEQSTGVVWAVDPDAGELLSYDGSGGFRGRWSGFSIPTRLSADPTEGGVWIVSFDAGLLYRVAIPFRKTVIDSTLRGPLDVAASPDGGCWVSESTGLVYRVSADGDVEAVEQLSRPIEISATDYGDAWVADPLADEVVRVSEDGAQARAGGFVGPYAVAAEPGGGCWVADAGRVVKVSRSGEIVLVLDGFSSARSLDVNRRTGECWVVDAEADRVVRLSPDGEWLAATTELSLPYRIQGYWR